ncbi:MAG: MFS transporter, partial [SAR324 cluster bacterium]|nr:MFS transporter [SAR324 cluster bacterium]
NHNLDQQLVPLDVPPQLRTALDAERINLAGAKLPESLAAELRGPLERAIDTSFVSAFRLAMFIAAGLAMASALSAVVFIEKRPPAPAA